ncbi:hypothetical protein Pgy4_25223 [Pseudomonas savastanoi pv. glycinea str. race 4]|uniref:Uncharacterized protein n=1 Tax=Pseudomonas savastanoi pv. glycinea str. race 4 TaxID=875330 RepID=F3CAR9_PSESG|nr:hypothetical protein Pgy4_25223 [Pseudomonas savastanoi pv. glycinea str. race 4]
MSASRELPAKLIGNATLVLSVSALEIFVIRASQR